MGNPDPDITTPSFGDTYFKARSFVRDAGTNDPTLEFTMVPAEIKTKPASYEDLGADGSIMTYCVRRELYADGGTEINFLETNVNITVNSDGTFSTENIVVEPKE